MFSESTAIFSSGIVAEVSDDTVTIRTTQLVTLGNWRRRWCGSGTGAGRITDTAGIAAEKASTSVDTELILIGVTFFVRLTRLITLFLLRLLGNSN